MNLHLPVETFDTLLVVLLGMTWRGYRRIWRHIARLEKRVLMVMMMLRSRGFEVPAESDTDVFTKANNLDSF